MNKVCSLYIHFPFCLSLCNYCDFYKKVLEEKVSDFNSYHHYLNEGHLEEEKFFSERDFVYGPLETLYLGGGTPSLWGKEGAQVLAEHLKKRGINLASQCEFTMEVNPGAWNDENISSFRELGVNRFSIGVQAFAERFLPLLGRSHNLKEVKRTLDYFSSLSVPYSVDLMLGLPLTSHYQRNLTHELDELLAYGPSHFSVYILTVKENYPHWNELPSEDEVAQEFLFVSDYLRSAGYLHYEVSNFAKSGSESRHNLKYWQYDSVGAWGPSATGLLVQGQGKEQAFRYKWKGAGPSFQEEQLGQNDIRLEKLYLGLRTNRGLTHKDLVTFSGLDESVVNKITSSWAQRHLSQKTDDRIVLTPEGYLLLDSLLGEIFSYLGVSHHEH